METRELICINCPLGCIVNVETDNGEIKKISGHSCRRGEVYARKEIINPVRIVTSTIRVKNGEKPLVSVKTKNTVPKDKIFECMAEINRKYIAAPVLSGDVIIENVAGTGVDIIATNDVKAV
jgi:CxxC motif-containing protein